jgi:hypothetical protein
VIEHTDRDATGTSIELPFTKEQLPATLAPPENQFFHDLLIELK